MIIELPLSSTSSARRYKLALYSFSNNNLSIRTSCAKDLSGYDVEAKKSEDVDICFRLAGHDHWVACQESSASVKHCARASFLGFIRQMWGWGWYLGYAYRKTGFRGLYVYVIGKNPQNCLGALELDASTSSPGLVVCFLTDFHWMHLFITLAFLFFLTGFSVYALCSLAVAAVFFYRYLRDIRESDLCLSQKCKVGLLQYLGNVSFITSAFVGALSRGVLLVPASILRPIEE